MMALAAVRHFHLLDPGALARIRRGEPDRSGTERER